MDLSFPTNLSSSLTGIFGISRRSRSVFSLRSSTLLASHGLPPHLNRRTVCSWGVAKEPPRLTIRFRWRTSKRIRNAFVNEAHALFRFDAATIGRSELILNSCSKALFDLEQ